MAWCGAWYGFRIPDRATQCTNAPMHPLSVLRVAQPTVMQQKTQRPVQFEITEGPATALRRRPGRRGVRLSFEAGSVHGQRSGRRQLLRKMQPVLLCLVLFDQPIDGRA